MVKCVNCGFLALRRSWTHELVEAAGPYRDEGQLPSDPQNRSFYSCERVPIRTERRRDFKQRLLLDGIGQDEVTQRHVVDALSEDYACDHHTQWHASFTPKEHREMLDRQWQLDFQAKREDADRVWREGQVAKDEKWREQESGKAERRHRWDLIITAGIVTVVLVLAQIGGSLIQAAATREAATGQQAPIVHISPVLVIATPLPSPAAAADKATFEPTTPP